MTYSSEVLADSPLAYWRLGESSGTTMLDSSSNGRNGTYQGGPSLGATGLLLDDSNTAVVFDGVDDVSLVPAAAWMTAPSFTAEAIFSPSTIAAGAGTIVCRNGAGPVWILRREGAKILGYVFAGGLFKSITSTTTLVAGLRYHAVLTYDGSTLRLYVGGSFETSLAVTGLSTATTSPVSIGANSLATPSECFAGTIDEVAFYGSALSAGRLAAHAAAAPPALSGTWGLVG